jgi:hypothetical protein
MGVEPPETSSAEGDLPPHLKRLRLLVTVLTVTMIAGVITITALLVIRLGTERPVVLVNPDDFALPKGVGAVGISVIDGRTVIVGDDGVIRVYDSENRALLQDMTVE